MTIIIGGARHDENGNYVGGKAGDQLQSGSGDDYTGEVSLCEFYVHKYGWYVLRPKTAELANKLAERMLASCNNKHSCTIRLLNDGNGTGSPTFSWIAIGEPK